MNVGTSHTATTGLLTKRVAQLSQRDCALGGLWATYDDHVRLIEKHGVEFLLLLIELNSLGVTAEAL